jgi:hypothetical protein
LFRSGLDQHIAPVAPSTASRGARP